MTERAEPAGISYASAGVDIEAGDRAVELLKPLAKKATRPEVRGGLGGFAGLFALRSYREPVLASSTDGVGQKFLGLIVGHHRVLPDIRKNPGRDQRQKDKRNQIDEIARFH